MSPKHKPVIWLKGKIKSPPFSADARLEAGFLIRQLQAGINLSLPHSRPMPEITKRCHELRVVDENKTWRIMYRIDPDAIVLAEIFRKQSKTTPLSVKNTCRTRLKEYDNACR